MKDGRGLFCVLCILALPACAAVGGFRAWPLVPRHCLSQLSLTPQSDLIKGRREKWSQLYTGALCAAVSAIVDPDIGSRMWGLSGIGNLLLLTALT